MSVAGNELSDISGDVRLVSGGAEPVTDSELSDVSCIVLKCNSSLAA